MAAELQNSISYIIKFIDKMQGSKTMKSTKNRQKKLLFSQLKPIRQPIYARTPYMESRVRTKSQKNRTANNIPRNQSALHQKNKIAQSISLSQKNKLQQSSVTNKKYEQQTTMTQPNDHELRYLYDCAIDSVYSMLDIFGRGVISEANITTQIPQKILYFLGEAFQKIRICRKPVTQSFFKEECLRLFRRSTEEDIMEFISEMKIKKGQKFDQLSIEQDEKNTIQSQVEHRMVFSMIDKQNTDRGQKKSSFKNNMKKEKKTERIKDEENLDTLERKKIQQRLKMSKTQILDGKNQMIKGIRYRNDNRKTLAPLVEINNFENVAKNHMKQTQKLNGFTNYNQEHKWEKPVYHNFNQNVESPCFRQSRRNLSNGQQTLKCEQIMRKYRPICKQQPHCPMNQKKKQSCINQEEGFKLSFSEYINNNSNHDDKNIKEREQSNDKLDRLSNRLEDYIKQNALRLQRSKNVRVDLQ